MKILLATSAAIPTGGGIASYNQELRRVFGTEHTFYLLTDADELDVKDYAKTISIYGKRINYSLCKYIISWIESNSFDLIINSNSSIIPIISPFIHSQIISISHFVNGKLAFNASYNSQYLGAVITLSEYGREYVINRFKITEPEKVHVIYNFVADKLGPHITKKDSSFPLTIVYPGGTSIQKSVDVVMDLLYRLQSTTLPFTFLWLGSTRLPSSFISPHKELTQFYKKDKRIQFLGNLSREKAVQVIESANIFLLPSRGEGCPMTLLEAMRAGCIPIVSDAHHGSCELLRIGGIGCIVKQDNVDMLMEIIVGIINCHDSYIDNYSKTVSFSKSFLSQSRWKGNMETVISDVIQQKRISIPFNYIKFLESYLPFKSAMILERFKTIANSLYYRAKFEKLYYKNH